MVQRVGIGLIIVLLIAFFIYIAILWKKGKIKKMAQKIKGE
jgi:succinate dehydrogenase hydrophobic anchor subunit